MQKATIKSNGRSQIVQLPEGFQFDCTEVYVKRIGRSVVLFPNDAGQWDILTESLKHFTDDFMEERAQPSQQEREAPFE